jgi:alpha-amylase/alpha-mannosidase (GH57 family)
MHQPDYRDASGVMQMPWVLLHAIKDYYDMPWMMARHEGVKATFNITAPLIEQLKLYYSGATEHDKFLQLWIKDPYYLDGGERDWIIKLCKSAQFDTMVSPLNRFVELYYQDHYNNSELLDLEVMFILSWCGVYLKENSPVVKEMLARGRDFHHDDKVTLLDALSNFVSGIFDYYSQLQQQERISLSTTPLNHPILPLLMDMNNAVIANSGTNIPKEHISLADDALKQVEKSKALFRETFGFLPNGFWPAEGGVDEKSVALLKSCGINWIATDEAILFKSLHSEDRKNLYSAYDYKGMCMGFRDHYLSDLIGFTYRHQNAYEASQNFMGELAKIEQQHSDGTVFVILDGENAWEFFANNGYDFFDALYKDLHHSSWCQTVTMDDVYALPKKELPYLAPGSWIHGEFNTWVGHSEKTRGWELIYLAKRDYEHHKEHLDDATKEKISDHFLAAECSDWFWWYGDDHYTEFGSEFDELFRNHLITIYNLMDITPPSDIFMPIIKDRSAQNFWLKPQSNISPSINGKRDSFFEWIGCGVIDEEKIFSTMDKKRGPVKKIYYGQDDENLYFSFEAAIKKLCIGGAVEIIIEPLNIRGSIELSDKKSSLGGLDIEVVCGDWLEICIDKRTISEKEIAIRFEIVQDERVIQTLPGFGELNIDLGNDYSQNWFI